MSATQHEPKHTIHTTPNPFGPQAYFESLPDTEANRKILSHWIDPNLNASKEPKLNAPTVLNDPDDPHETEMNPFGPQAYFKSLPDTEANRKILSHWTDPKLNAPNETKLNAPTVLNDPDDPHETEMKNQPTRLK